MRDLDLRELRRRLLQGGLAPKHVNRTLKELRHHFADLERNAVSEGLSKADAIARAKEGLGDPELVIEEALSRPELKSWAYRWPWGIYGLIPVAAFSLTVVGLMVGVVSLLEFAERSSGLSPAEFATVMFDQRWAIALLEIWRVTILHILPSGFAAALCIFAARRDAPILWPTVGVFLILFLSFSQNLSVTPPAVRGELGEIGAGIGFSADWLFSARGLRLLIPLVLVLGPYYCWRQRQPEVLPA